MASRQALARGAMLLLVAGCDGSASLWLSGQSQKPGEPVVTSPEEPGVEPQLPPLPLPDTPLRRLTRRELVNTVRDLLYLPAAPAIIDLLPSDTTSTLFDNNADTLNVDDALLEKYDAAATVAVDGALAGPSRSRLVPCDLAADAAACLRTVVGAFAHRAWRRPVTAVEVDELMTALDVATGQGEGAETAVALALRTVLASPNFLYRVELDAPGTTGAQALSPHELATRLSYFVWSSTPDDALLAKADDGSLSDPAVASAELSRLLADRRADALIDDFGAQWLDLRKLETAGVLKVDPTVYPAFDDELRQAMVQESKLFLRDLLSGERGLSDMLDANVTFANERLARHYGLSGVVGTELTRVSLAGTPRLGLLSHASVLTLTSVGNRTSPTRRGKWVLSRLMCAPPRPPPANVEELDPTRAGLPPDATIRQQLEAHRADPRCASCHTEMDPIGLGLEHYDGIGAWRSSYGGAAIDATGVLPGGTTFDGAQELAGLLKRDARLVPCFVESAYSYALGRRAKSAADVEEIERLTKSFAGGGARGRELVALIVSSGAFQTRGGQP